MILHKINISDVTPKNLIEGNLREELPEFYNLKNITENNLWHNNQNVFDHVVKVYSELDNILNIKDLNEKDNNISYYLSQKIGNKERLEILKISVLLHDIAKSSTYKKMSDGTSSCPDHEKMGKNMVNKFSKRFILSNDEEKYIERIVGYHGYISEIINFIIENGLKDKYFSEFKEKVGDVAVELTILMKADLMGSDLKINDPIGFNKRLKTINWMIKSFLKK